MNTDQISDGAREARNDYQRAWRRRNPQKLRQYMNAYWQRRFEQQQQKIAVPGDDGKPRMTANQLELLMPR